MASRGGSDDINIFRNWQTEHSVRKAVQKIVRGGTRVVVTNAERFCMATGLKGNAQQIIELGIHPVVQQQIAASKRLQKGEDPLRLSAGRILEIICGEKIEGDRAAVDAVALQLLYSTFEVEIGRWQWAYHEYNRQAQFGQDNWEEFEYSEEADVRLKGRRKVGMGFLCSLVEQDGQGVTQLRVGVEGLSKAVLALANVDVSLSNWRFSGYRLRAASGAKGEEEDGDDDGEDQEKRYGKEGSVGKEDDEVATTITDTATLVEAKATAAAPDEEWEM